MRHTVHLLVDEMAAAVGRTAELLLATPFPVHHLTIAAAGGRGQARITVVFEAPDGAPVAEYFARAAASTGVTRRLAPVRPSPEPMVPFHWQADGAGDHRAV